MSKRVHLKQLKRGVAAAALLTMTGLAASLLPSSAWAEEAPTGTATEAVAVQPGGIGDSLDEALQGIDEALNEAFGQDGTGVEEAEAQPESRTEGRRHKDCDAWWDHKPWRGKHHDPCKDRKDRKHKKCPPGWVPESAAAESGQEEALEEGWDWRDKCKKKKDKDRKHKKCPPGWVPVEAAAESGQEEALEEGWDWRDKCKKKKKDKDYEDDDNNDLLPVTGTRNLALGGAGLMLIGMGLASWLLAGRRRVRA